MRAIVHGSRAGLSLLLALSVLGSSGCMPPGPRALLKGERLVQRGRAVQAIPLLEQAVEHLPQEPRAWNQLGLAYHAAGRPNEAEQAYRRALAFNTNFAAARFNLGSLWLEQNHAERAIPELLAYTRLATNAPMGWIKLGYAQLRANQAATAESSFARALQLQSNAPVALNGIGVSLTQRRRPAEAWPYFAAAARRQPDYAPAQLNLAILSQQTGREPEDTASAYKRYLALRNAPFQNEVRGLLQQLQPPPQPEPIPATPAKATTSPPEVVTATVQTSKPPPAVEAPPVAPAKTEVVATKPPGRPEAAAPPPPARSSEVESAPPADPGRTAAATEAPASTPSETPRTAVPRREEPPTVSRAEPAPGTASPGDGPTPSTRPALPGVAPREAVATAPRVSVPAPVPVPAPPPRPAAQVDMPAHLQAEGLGYPYAPYAKPAAGNRQEAITLLNEGINAHRGFRVSEALELYRRAAAADPSLFEVHYNRGVAAFELGEMGEALRAYEQALAVDPDSVPARYNFATTLRRSGYPADAAAQLEHLLAAHPDEARAQLALGDLYARHFRDRQRARECYLRVLTLEPQHPNAAALRLWLEAN